MNDITTASEHKAEKLADKKCPKGYTLWSVYPSESVAKDIRKRYGQKSDRIIEVGGYWALYGLKLDARAGLIPHDPKDDEPDDEELRTYECGCVVHRDTADLTYCKTHGDAPELLEVVRAMLKAFDVGQKATATSAIGRARAAIRKILVGGGRQ